MVPNNSAKNAERFAWLLFGGKFVFRIRKDEIRKYNLVCLVCFVVYMDVLSVSMRFRLFFCIYEHV